MAARLSALRASRTLPPGFFLIFKDSWYSFLLEAESTPGPVRPEGLDRPKCVMMLGTNGFLPSWHLESLYYSTAPQFFLV
jgi:hypothetical protein